MSFGKNLQHLRHLCGDMTQEALAEKLDVSRQTISQWELDTAQPDMDKAIELCKLFNCTLDNLFREKLDVYDEAYVDLRVETVPAFRYVKHAVISSDPEGDAIDRVFYFARQNGVENPRVIGWDFPHLSQEQINVFHMHGYEAAWILPEGLTPPGLEIHEQKSHKYAAITIEFDKCKSADPFVTIPGAYKTLMEYMRLNGLEHTEKDVIPCFETDGGNMNIYIACL